MLIQHQHAREPHQRLGTLEMDMLSNDLQDTVVQRFSILSESKQDEQSIS
jgi:hypothetical protein